MESIYDVSFVWLLSLLFYVVFGYLFVLVFVCSCYYLCDLVCTLPPMSIVLVFFSKARNLLSGCLSFGLFWVRVVRKDIFPG